MATDTPDTHGEGDYEATRRYRKRTEKFMARNNIGKIARAAAPRTKAEVRELQEAEAVGRARANGRSTPSAGRSRPRR